MPHFFIPPENISANRFHISGKEVHYLLNVRRVKPGDTLELFDGTGKTYTARIDSADKNEISGVIINEALQVQGKIKIHLYQSVPKGERFDWLIEKCAELGINAVTPLVTARSIQKTFTEPKLQRWQRLSLASSQQSRRPDIMKVASPVNFLDAISAISREDINIIPWEGEDKTSIPQACSKLQSSSSVNIFIGPEGGFTMDEIEEAQKHGIIPVTMGNKILRAETAGILASAIALFLSREFS